MMNNEPMGGNGGMGSMGGGGGAPSMPSASPQEPDMGMILQMLMQLLGMGGGGGGEEPFAQDFDSFDGSRPVEGTKMSDTPGSGGASNLRNAMKGGY